jgi:hypothetical protein
VGSGEGSSDRVHRHLRTSAARFQALQIFYSYTYRLHMVNESEPPPCEVRLQVLDTLVLEALQARRLFAI